MNFSDVIIFGVGQIGNAVASILEEREEHKILGFIDDNTDLHGEAVRTYRCLGGREVLDAYPDVSVMVAVGQVDPRRAINTWLEERGIEIISAIHPTAYVPPEATIGAGSIVGASVTLYVNPQIGKGVFIGPSATISHDTAIGDYALVSAGSVIGARVDIETGGFVGAGATVMPTGWGSDKRLRIGVDALVGAGSVVVRQVRDRSVVFGVPAKHVRFRDE